MSRSLPAGVTAGQWLALHEAAADWFTRRQAADWADADEQALAAWLGASPLHRQVFSSLGSTRQLLAELPQFRAETARAAARDPQLAASRPARPGLWQRLVRRPALGLASGLLAFALLIGGWYAWDNTARYQLSVATGVGETRQLDLPDGSQLAVNIDSRLEVRYYPRRREVILSSGEVFFQVAKDPARPFTVDAGPSRLTVVGTAFNVRAAPPRLVVKVSEGQVAVQANRRARPTADQVLPANAGLAVDPASGRLQSVVVAAGTVGDWRSGHLRLERMPLAEVAEELSRYLGRPVSLASSELASWPVSGFLATAQPEGFLELLPDLVSVRVKRAGEGWVISRR